MVYKDKHQILGQLSLSAHQFNSKSFVLWKKGSGLMPDMLEMYFRNRHLVNGKCHTSLVKWLCTSWRTWVVTGYPHSMPISFRNGVFHMRWWWGSYLFGFEHDYTFWYTMSHLTRDQSWPTWTKYLNNFRTLTKILLRVLVKKGLGCVCYSWPMSTFSAELMFSRSAG